ncbi:MAG: hypothetical protein ACE15F_17550 [bacterium]
MKNNRVIVLVFLLGLVCGTVFNWLFRPGPDISPAVTPSTAEQSTSSPEEEGTEPPISPILSERFLPNTAPYWLLADLKGWRQHSKGLTDLFQQETVSKVWNQFAASLPRGATPALEELLGHADEMRLFILPPEGGSAPPVAVAAFSIPNITAPDAPDSPPPGIHSLTASYPEAATREIVAGSKAIQVIESPLGRWGWRVDAGLLWISSQPDSLAQLWSTPPPPASVESIGPQAAVREKYPDTMAALFVNARHPGIPIPGGLGALTQAMRDAGIGQASCLLRFPENRGIMTVLAHAESATPWVEHWTPLQEFPFKDADPAGLIELALRWPGMDVPLAATAAVEPPSPALETSRSATGVVESPSPVLGTPLAAFPTGDGTPVLTTDYREENLESLLDPEWEMPLPGRKGERPFRFRPGEVDSRPMGAMVARAQLRFLTRLFPPGKEIGVNFFGFYADSPALAVAIPTLDINPTPQQRLEALPFLEKEAIEVALIPGALYRFRDTPYTQFLGLQELLVLERDAVAYLFDAREAARNYLEEKEHKDAPRDTRSKRTRSLLEHVRTPAQIQLVINEDFYKYVLNQEKKRIPGDFPYKDDLFSLLDELLDHTKPMAASGGWADSTWFLETYTESETALLLNTSLMILALSRFLGY